MTIPTAPEPTVPLTEVTRWLRQLNGLADEVDMDRLTSRSIAVRIREVATAMQIARRSGEPHP